MANLTGNDCNNMNVLKGNAIVLLLLLLPVTVTAGDITSHKTGIWSITPTATMKRWIIIHNLQEAKISDVFHIEVIGRGNGDAVWQVQHLVSHMAITGDALRKSIIKPLNRGGVYPETYENAYSEWLKENNGSGGSICKTSVMKCM